MDCLISGTGGDALRALTLAKQIAESKATSNIVAKIYFAGSAAGDIALASRERMMAREGSQVLHLSDPGNNRPGSWFRP
jgi:hypothetical protein